MKDLLKFLLGKITGKKEFTIEETNNNGRINFQVYTDPENIGLIIGKNGRTIKAIQNILKVRARLEKVSVFIGVSESKQNSKS